MAEIADATQEPWTVTRCLNWTAGYFERLGVPQPRLSAEWLLQDATGFKRIDLYTKFDYPLGPEELAKVREGIKRRAQGEPLQYITGETAFRQLSLLCEPGVLIPRPETELLVELVLDYLDKEVTGWKKPAHKRIELPWNAEVEAVRQAEAATRAAAEEDDGAAAEAGGTDEAVAAEAEGAGEVSAGQPPRCARVLEIGCGTGCISLSMAHERPGCVRCVAIDISEKAIDLALRNRARCGISPDAVDIRKGDLTEPVRDDERSSFDVLISNPPYIPTSVLEAIPHEVRDFEPHLALDGGKDGLAIFRRLVSAAPYVLKRNGLLACELFEDALEEAAAIAESAGLHNVRILSDLTGRTRYLFAQTG